MTHYHAVVWIDHREARIFFFDRHAFDEVKISSKDHNCHLHHKAGNVSGNRTPEDQHFFHEVVDALKPASEWLITGPSSAKLELMKHIQKHDHEFSDHVVGIESADHPTDKQLVAHARAYFQAADRMRPQI